MPRELAVVYNEDLQNIADAIREVNGEDLEEVKYTPSSMASGVAQIGDRLQEAKTVELYLADGDQEILPDDMSVEYPYLAMKSILISKPATLLSENIKSGINIAGIDGNYQGGVDNSTSIIDGTISEITNYTSIIRDYTFNGCVSLTRVDFPSCKTVGSYAFSGCTSLANISFPLCDTIWSYAFAECWYLKSAVFPMCTKIGGSAFLECRYGLSLASFSLCESVGYAAFDHCVTLEEMFFPICRYVGVSAFRGTNASVINLPSCTSIDNSAFSDCTRIGMVSLPMCETIGNTVFYNNAFSSIELPLCTSIGNGAFSNCRKLEFTSFPNLVSIGTQAFRSCYSLSTLSLPKCNVLMSSTFLCCYNLLSLYLLGSSYVGLSHINAFSSTPIAGYTTSTGGIYGSIYFRASMLDTYKTMTNWIAYSDRMVGLTDQEIEAL